jgi:hypothetical protein
MNSFLEYLIIITGFYERLFLLIKIIHILLVSLCVCTDNGTSSVLLEIRIRFVKSYPHCVITRCVKKKFRFVN